jgi:hypothetical protein
MIRPHLPLFLAACSLLLAACSSSNVAPQEGRTSLSREEELVERNVAARGGLDRLQAVESLTTTGTVNIPAMGVSMALLIRQERPSKLRAEVEAEGMGKFVTGYDGTVAWTINPMVGRRPQRLRGLQERDVVEQADFDGLLMTYREKGYVLEYAGEEQVREQPAHKLRLVRPDSSETFLYLDPTTYLVVKTEGETLNPMTNGVSKIETYPGDYREVNGVMMPFAMEVAYDGQLYQRETISGVQVNENVEDSVFALPGN